MTRLLVLPQSVAEAVDLSEVTHVVDLGGGPGHYAIAMLERSSILRATVVDLPLTLLVASDLFDSEKDIPIAPETADLVLISHMVHMEGSQQNAALIRKAARLLPLGGRLVIHDMFLEEDRAHPQLSSLCAVHMLAMIRRGEVYPTSVISGWLTDAGLRSRVLSTSPFLIEGMRPASSREAVSCEPS